MMMIIITIILNMIMSNFVLLGYDDDDHHLNMIMSNIVLLGYDDDHHRFEYDYEQHCVAGI